MTKQVTISITAVEIMGEDYDRTAYSIINMDSAITVYIGKKPTVSSTTGMPLYPRQSMNKSKMLGDNTRQRMYAIAASDSPVIGIMEEYGV